MPLLRALVGSLALGLAPVASAEDYWTYSNQNVDVVATGLRGYAINLADNCLRLDHAFSEILHIRSTQRPPVHLYALSGAEMQRLVGANLLNAYHTGWYDETVAFVAGPREFWGAYFGYIAMLLAADEQLKGPDWYMVGVPGVFADVRFDLDKVTIGVLDSRAGVNPLAAHLTTASGLIPMRQFLAMKSRDFPDKTELYQAESWALAHAIYIEGLHRPEFDQYLGLMRQGRTEPEAFAASFRISYEDLDKDLRASYIARAYIAHVPASTPADPATVRVMPPAELKARFALVAQTFGQSEAAVSLANEALQHETGNETALRALALAQLQRRAYAEALAAVDRLAGQSRSAAAYADSGIVLGRLAHGLAAGQATLPVDAGVLKQRARDDLQRAIAADSCNCASARLIGLVQSLDAAASGP